MPNHRGESAIIEDSYYQEHVEESTEQQHIWGVPTEQEEIRGDSIQDATNNTTENPIEDKISVTAKAVKPREKFVRESYLKENLYVMYLLLTITVITFKETIYIIYLSMEPSRRTVT